MTGIEAQTAQANERQVNKAWFFAVLSFAIFGAQSAVFMVPPLLVEISTDLEISVAVAGQLATATFAAWAVSLVLVGPLSDSFGRRPVVIAGMLLLVVSVLASAFAPNIEVFLALRVLTGLGGGTLPPNAVGALSDVISPARRAQAISATLAIGMLPLVISVPVVAVLADWRDWRFAFLLAGLLLALGLLANWLWFPSGGHRVRNWAFFSRYSSLVSLRFFRVAIAVALTQRIAMWTLVSFFAAYLIQTHGLSVRFAGLLLAVVAIGQVAGSYFAGFVATKRYRAALIAATSAVGGICAFLCFTFELELWVLVAVATVGAALLSVTMPALVSASTEYSGESKASGASLMGLSNQSGGALGAAIAGGLLAGAGYWGIGYLCLGVTMASALITALLGRELRLGGS